MNDITTMNNPKRIIIQDDIIEKIKEDCSFYYPEEACGLLAGLIENESFTVKRYFSMTNIYHSPVAYRLDPKEQIQVFKEIDKLNYKLLAISHSHPQGQSFPSTTDIQESHFPDTIYLIWYPSNIGWRCKGYIIKNKSVEEVSIIIQRNEKATKSIS